MLLLIKIWVAVAVLVWGIILTLVGIGTHSLSKSRLRSNYPIGASNLLPILLGMLTVGVGLALLVSALGWSPLAAAIDSLIAGALFLLSIQLAKGHARFENNLSLTMIKWPKADRGIFSRFIGIIVAVAALVFLAASVNLFGWRLSPGLIVRIVDVCATLFAAILVNVVTGSLAPKSDVPRWLITATGVVVFVLLLVETPLLDQVRKSPTPISPPAPSEAVEIVPSKTVVHIGEEVVLTVRVDATIRAPTFQWSADYGSVPADWVAKSSIKYTAPAFTTVDTIRVTVRDADGNLTTGEVQIQVVSGQVTVPPDSYSVSISEPKTGPLGCPGDGPCFVRVEGQFEGPNQRQGLTVLVLVLPVDPPGNSWWIQSGLTLDRLDGTWSVIATLGEEKTPPVTGHKFSIRALLVEQSVADNPAYAPSVNLEDYTVIPRLAASERVNLDIQSP